MNVNKQLEGSERQETLCLEFNASASLFVQLSELLNTQVQDRIKNKVLEMKVFQGTTADSI